MRGTMPRAFAGIFVPLQEAPRHEPARSARCPRPAAQPHQAPRRTHRPRRRHRPATVAATASRPGRRRSQAAAANTRASAPSSRELLDLDEHAQIDARRRPASSISIPTTPSTRTSRWPRAARGSSPSRARCCTTPAATACSASATRREAVHRGDGQAAGDGQHHDAQPVAAALRPRAARRDRPHAAAAARTPKFLCLNSGSESVSLAGAHRRRQHQAA